jgi:hypothetical protein
MSASGASKFSARITRGSRSMPESPGYLLAMPSPAFAELAIPHVARQMTID